MTTDFESKPFWYQIEEQIGKLSDSDFADGAKELAVHKLASALDDLDLNVSRTAGKLLSVRRAVDARARIRRPLIEDLTHAYSKFSLEDLGNIRRAAFSIVGTIGQTWPVLRDAENVADMCDMLEVIRLDLMIDKAKGLDESAGIRYLREEGIPTETILERLSVGQEQLDEVDAAIAAEKAEIQRVKNLLDDVSDKAEIDRIKHLLSSDVSDELIVEIAEVPESAIAEAKKAMEEELKEKQRLAEEEAARKKKEAEGPSLDDIEPDDLEMFIEDIREILDFVDSEKEIRAMCEQSNIPKCLVDIAVENPDKLDELEEA